MEDFLKDPIDLVKIFPSPDDLTFWKVSLFILYLILYLNCNYIIKDFDDWTEINRLQLWSICTICEFSF